MNCSLQQVIFADITLIYVGFKPLYEAAVKQFIDEHNNSWNENEISLSEVEEWIARKNREDEEERNDECERTPYGLKKDQKQWFECDLCAKKFKTAVKLESHAKTHDKLDEERPARWGKEWGEQKVKCEQCAKVMKQKNLSGHVNAVHKVSDAESSNNIR